MTGWLGLPARMLAALGGWRRSAGSAIRQRLSRPIAVQIVDEEPAVAKPRRLYVSMRAGRPAVGWLRCPCGCGDVISLRLAGERSPRWSVATLSGPANLEPSVWRKSRCRSHFILRRGRIHWC